MLGRFSTALQHAAELLAPPPPLFEDFVYYWKKLMNHYLDVTKTKPTLIELTNIPNHLEHLLQILIKEGETSDGAGACMEYFLQHNLLDLLTTLAATDDPPGMKQHVLQLVAKLLNQSKHIDFGHSSVYSALQRLIGLCDGSTPTASESYEIQFLLSLSGILRRNYQLVPVFISHSSNEGESSTERRTSCSSTSSDASSTPRNALFTTPLVPSARSCNVTLVPQPVTVCLGNSSQSDSHPQFPIADAVLSYLDSPDTGVRLKACQALMLLVSLPDGTNTASLISSEVSLRLISRLVLLFYTIPHSTDPSHIDEMHLSWGLDIPTNDCTGCNGCKQAATFLSWFDYCDQVMIEGNQSIAEAVSQRFSESFLGQAFNSLALHKPINLTMLTKCFKMASSPLLNDALNEWFTCDSILNILLENWSSQDTDLAIETLRFFELILEKSSDYVLDCLIWRYLKERTFLNSYTSATGALSEDGGNLEINGGSEQEIYVIIKRWTNIVPKDIQSCNCGYEEYIGESMRQYQAVLSKVESQQNATQDLPSSDAEFNEGPFLSALFTALSNIPKQAYELNLELTGIVSRLALRPETYLTEYMLNNTKQLKVRSLYSVLMGVAAELGNCITQFPDYQKTLSDVRATLLGRSMASLELKPDPWIGTFESIVVVEELCKELAAISYVKLKANGA